MAITHTWSVDPNLKTKDQDGHSDVVYSVVCRLISSETVGSGDDAVTYEAQRSTQVTLDTSDLSNFTAFASLTEAEVLGWAKATIDATSSETGIDCAEMEAGHQRNIEKQKNPPTRVQIAPWS